MYHKNRDRKWFKTQRAYSTWNARYAGKEITCIRHGYKKIHFLGVDIELHRLIWFYQTGEWPNVIDHINGDKLDNRWENLRNVTQFENCRNVRRRKDNISGTTGVHWSKRRNKWIAKIQNEDGKTISLGSFSSKKEAIVVRKTAEIKYGYSSTHGRQK